MNFFLSTKSNILLNRYNWIVSTYT